MLTLLLIPAVILIFAILIVIDKIRFKKNRRYHGYETREYGIFVYILIAIISVFIFVLIITRLCFYLDINNMKEDYYAIMRDKISITDIEDESKYEQFARMINDRVDVYNRKVDEFKECNASPWLNIYIPNDVEYLLYIDKIE